MDIRELIHLGRFAVWNAFEGKEISIPEHLKEKYSQNMGVFTTLKTYPEHNLRGCIGVPLPVYPLWYATVYSSLQAAFQDPRFYPLRKEEFDKVVWEITLLTPPEEIKVPKEELPEVIEIGKDGLIIERGENKGLLLPQVPVEHGWSPIEFLEYTCLKAGLPKDCWKCRDTKVYRFSGEVYQEKEPFGEVEKVILK
ncbi:MAG: TIGR00296 family protein [Aquifex sp.]|nr:MAG: TIGR00296 family protein [Aquifex sp.]